MTGLRSVVGPFRKTRIANKFRQTEQTFISAFVAEGENGLTAYLFA